MTRMPLKLSLATLSVAAILGSWAVLARQDQTAATDNPAASPAVMSSAVTRSWPTPMPIPTLVPSRNGEGAAISDVDAGLTLPPIPTVTMPQVAIRPQPLARTRSSR